MRGHEGAVTGRADGGREEEKAPEGSAGHDGPKPRETGGDVDDFERIAHETSGGVRKESQR